MSNLSLPPTSGNLVMNNVTVPSGYANYFLLAYQQMSIGGETLEGFLVRQMIYQSVERYAKHIVQQDYDATVASGVFIQELHGIFVSNIATEEKTLLRNYGN